MVVFSVEGIDGGRCAWAQMFVSLGNVLVNGNIG
jgi:hypothetical protein